MVLVLLFRPCLYKLVHVGLKLGKDVLLRYSRYMGQESRGTDGPDGLRVSLPTKSSVYYLHVFEYRLVLSLALSFFVILTLPFTFLVSTFNRRLKFVDFPQRSYTRSPSRKFRPSPSFSIACL